MELVPEIHQHQCMEFLKFLNINAWSAWNSSTSLHRVSAWNSSTSMHGVTEIHQHQCIELVPEIPQIFHCYSLECWHWSLLLHGLPEMLSLLLLGLQTFLMSLYGELKCITVTAWTAGNVSLLMHGLQKFITVSMECRNLSLLLQGTLKTYHCYCMKCRNLSLFLHGMLQFSDSDSSFTKFYNKESVSKAVSMQT